MSGRESPFFLMQSEMPSTEPCHMHQHALFQMRLTTQLFWFVISLEGREKQK